MTVFRRMLCALACSALLLTVATSHPQCLDFRPPFEAGLQLSFCSNYTEFGCCTSFDDASLQQEYLRIQRTLSGAGSSSSSNWTRCQGYVREVLCQQCSPYAAHVYDAERTMQARSFPGLCADYCRSFFESCSSVIALLDPTLSGSPLLQQQASEAFCQHVGLSDVDYCYPDLLANPQFSSDLQRRQQASTDGCLCLDPVAQRLASPLLGRHAGDGSGRLFVAEQPGVVRILYPKDKLMLPVPFLNITARVETSNWFGDERGFLGLAFHRRFAENGRFFVYYSTPLTDSDGTTELEEAMGMDSLDHKIRISEMRVSQENPNIADGNYEKVILEINQPYANHNGGELLFLEDDYLYIFVGDGGASGDPHNVSQNRESLLGKVLRLDVDSQPDQPYSIPRDNPFVNSNTTRPEIFALGVRNIWRCGVDPGDRRTGERRGLVVCGDVGQNSYEELNILKKGANYGWRAREGFECYDDEMCGNIGREELPIHAYPHSEGKSVTGGQFYRGCESPSLDGLYLYGDYMNGYDPESFDSCQRVDHRSTGCKLCPKPSCCCGLHRNLCPNFFTASKGHSSKRLFSLKEDSPGHWGNSELSLCGSDICFNGLTNEYDKYIMSFGQDQDGEIYVLTSRSSRPRRRDGKVFRLVDPQRRGNPAACPSARKEGRVPTVEAQGQSIGTSGPASMRGPSIAGISVRRNSRRRSGRRRNRHR